MSLLFQIVFTYLLVLLSNIISAHLYLPIPVSIIGITLLLIALLSKIISLKHIDTVSSFFLKNMGFFFIAAGVSILGKYYLIENILWQFSIIIFITTILTFTATAFAVKYTMKLQQKLRKTNYKKST